MALHRIAFLFCIAALPATQALSQPPRADRGPKRLRPPDRLSVGDEAPDFTLSSPDGKQTVTLSSYRGKQPVALVFGSYT